MSSGLTRPSQSTQEMQQYLEELSHAQSSLEYISESSGYDIIGV